MIPYLVNVKLWILLGFLFLFSQLFFFCYFLYLDEPEQDSLYTWGLPVLRSSPWRIEVIW